MVDPSTSSTVELEPNDNESGITTVTVAVSMLLLLGFAAIAVDGSNLYRERSDVQNASDHAAYAAAYEACTGGSDADAITTGLNLAIANGFDDASPEVWVQVQKEGSDWRATVDSTIDGFFSQVLGASTLNTHATALAKCTTSVVAGYALFAGGQCGQNTLDWSGSDNSVTGGVHSNDGIDVSGSNNTINGSTTSTSGISDGGGGNLYNPPATTTSVQPWPQNFDVDDFVPVSEGGNASVEATVGSTFYHFYDGKIDSGVLSSEGWISGTTIDPGVYVATDDIDLSDSGLTGTVTFVTAPDAEGKGIITLSGSNHDLDPYYQSLLLFSDAWKGNPGYPWDPPPPDHPDCFDPAIKLSGSDHNWEGIMFAPRGLVELSGSTNVGIQGSIIAYTIRLNGSTQQITFSGAGGGGNPVTVLVE